MLGKYIVLTGVLIWTAAVALAQPKLLRQTRPSYPAEAKQAGISGTVVVEGMITPTGAVHDVRSLSGPPVLADAVVEAVSRWQYSPVVVDGNPVAARTKVTVKFELPGSVAIEDNVSGANSLRPVHSVRPAYPPDAKAAGVSGQVRLRAVVGRDGSVVKLDVVSGDAALAQSAVEAVRQWKYEPTTLGGQPV
jgi:TonB family protein